ncbi:hypothetical protein L6164_024244 [Bauhinia variegata]|uniref:Uncharacterized protein n=1 Tax=Bauhinia variegata TaxID=167791 RepID=A0ACB9LZ77_BAUVA|nr:hypothetical protein L6164_024244 [Bauhinia variegata]
MQSVQGGCSNEPNALLEENHLEAEVLKLRRRWELASVLNFLEVFAPLIGKGMKVSAEEIEMGLIKPTAALAQLHIALLKGTPPVSKNLDDSDAWVTALCKKLSMWWPWVGVGSIPLKPIKGEEISKYKELDPSDRLILLKALCEVRADQHDAVSYVNDALKEGTQISYFRKNALGRDENGTSYWYDASANYGHRLYEEVITLNSNTKAKGKESLPTINFQWETLASNLQEFSKVVEEFSSSKVAAKIAVGEKIQSDAIPILQKLYKKAERKLKRKQRQDKVLNDFQNSCRVGITRSCRSRKPISYTFDDYDRAINEAIRLTKKGKLNEDPDTDGGSEDKSSKVNSTDSHSKRDILDEVDSDDTGYEIANTGGSGREDDFSGESYNSEADASHAVSNSLEQMDNIAIRTRGTHFSKRLAGESSHFFLEARGLTTKHRLRQRPTCNSALESIVIPDSDDEIQEGES